MLFDLKRTKKKNFFKRVALGGVLKPFDPLDLPNYQAGYYMNLTTDTPPGSINPVLTTPQWFDKLTLIPGGKVFLHLFSNTVLTVVNGFNAQTLPAGGNYFVDVNTSIINGLTDFCLMIGFKRNTLATTLHYLFWGADQASTVRSYLGIAPAGTLQLLLSDWVTNLFATTTNRYDDNNYHCAVCFVNQTTKSVRLFTDLGEDISNTNVLLPAPIPFNYTSQNRCQLGYYLTAVTAFSPGVLGDAIILNSIPDLTTVNKLMKWECTRLGIPYVIF